MTPSASNPGLLDEFLQALTQQPITLLLLALLIVGFWFSTPVTLLALLFFVVTRTWPKLIIVIGIVGALLALITLSLQIGMDTVHAQNHFFYRAIKQQKLSLLFNPFLWLSALPYALLFAASFAALWQLSTPLKKELRRLEKGKPSASYRSAPQRQLKKRLQNLPATMPAFDTVLGVNRETAAFVALSDNDANLHTLAVGTTGSGKTTAVANMVESAILRQMSVCYIDGKGDLDLAHRIKAFAQSQKVPFYLFSMVGESLTYNPLATGGYTAKKDRIIELREWSEDHYRKIAEGYLQTVFRLLEEAELSVDLHTLAQYLEPASWFSLARSLKKSEWIPAIEMLEKRRDSIESLIAEVQNMAESEIGHLFQCGNNDKVITLEKVIKQNGIVYFCLQPLAFPAYAETLGKLIINDLKALLAAQLNNHSPKKLLAVFDEFSVFVGDQVINVINQGRGAGMQAVLATQSLSDIQRKGGDALLGQVLNNVNNYIIQRQNYPADAETLSNIVGTKVGFNLTSKLSTKDAGYSTGTVRSTREFIIHPDEIKRLGLGEAIFVNKQRFNMQRILVRRGCLS